VRLQLINVFTEGAKLDHETSVDAWVRSSILGLLVIGNLVGKAIL
jgi:hypothetical protein